MGSGRAGESTYCLFQPKGEFLFNHNDMLRYSYASNATVGAANGRAKPLMKLGGRLKKEVYFVPCEVL